MVQYVITPWRDRAELLKVKAQFCTQAPAPKPQDVSQSAEQRKQKRKEQHMAVARVAMWMQRGNCPHLVESTALLTAAVLSDEEARDDNVGSASYALRAAYSAAFSRFVTGLLDGHQDKQRKQSMYAIAKNIGLPATFVELRHQSTHEQLPSLTKLRDAARRALDYIWDYYWKNLEDEPPAAPLGGSGTEDSDPCKATVMQYLREFNPARQRDLMQEMRARWGVAELEAAVKQVQGRLPGNQAWLKGMQMVRELKAAQEEEQSKNMDIDDTQTQQEAEEQGSEAKMAALGAPTASTEPTARFMTFEGTWTPRPIGALFNDT